VISTSEWTITPIYVGAAMPLLPWAIFVSHFFFVIACWVKQTLTEVFSSLAMCDSVSLQAVSWMAITWTALQLSIGVGCSCKSRRKLFRNIIQTTTSTPSSSGPCTDSYTREINSVRPMWLVFRSKGYIYFALLRAKHFLTFKMWLPSAKFLCSRHLCHSDVQCLGVPRPLYRTLGNP
jgi:hypothetical protein